MLNNNILVEVDWNTWQRWGRSSGDGGARVEMMIVTQLEVIAPLCPK
jgi:hypothetical protein